MFIVCRYVSSFVFIVLATSPSALFPQSINSAAAPTALDQTIQKFGGRPPADAVMVGNVTITAGSTREEGTVRIVTKDATHSAETYDTPTSSRHIAFANGIGAERKKDQMKEMPFGRMLSAHSALSPLSFLAGRLADPAAKVDDLGVDSTDGMQSHHLKISNDWSKDKNLAAYQEFSACDVWIDTGTSLPQAISYGQREGLGAIPWVAIRIEYEDYRTIAGRLYPFHITKYVNGTKWADIHLTSVTLDSGVATSEFAIK